MEIRPLKVVELPKLEIGAREFYSSSKFLKDFIMERFVSFWTQLINNESGIIFVMMDEGTEPQGAIGGVIYPEPYGKEFVATEFFWFVRPEHRGNGIALYDAFEKWAVGKNASQIRMVHLSDLMPDALKRLYHRLGYEEVETLYAKELP